LDKTQRYNILASAATAGLFLRELVLGLLRERVLALLRSAGETP
jgi:hypothetical protein